MVEDILDFGEFYIKVRCPECKKLIELDYSEWENPTKPAKKKRTCDCSKEWGITITAETKGAFGGCDTVETMANKDFYNIIINDMSKYCVEIENNLFTYEEIFKE